MTTAQIDHDYAAWLANDDYDASEIDDEYWAWEAEQRRDEAAGFIAPAAPMTDAEIDAMCAAAGYDEVPF